MAVAPREWNNSCVDCCSPFSTFCLTIWCPCMTYGRTRHRVQKDPSLAGYSSCNGACCGYAALQCCGFQWVMQFMQRGEMRRKYNLEGGGCDDCLRAWCCPCCDLMQQDKEAKDREAERNPMLDQDKQPARHAEPGMVYVQPGQRSPASNF